MTTNEDNPTPATNAPGISVGKDASNSNIISGNGNVVGEHITIQRPWGV